VKRVLFLLVGSALWLGCGGHNPVAPTPVESTPTTSATVASSVPPFMYGFFAASSDVPEIPNWANTIIVVPSYSDDAALIAKSLEARGQVAILSAHHVFGNPKSMWPAEWAHTQAWAAPFRSRIVAVLVVDEPQGNGIPDAQRDEAIGIVRAAGFRTVTTERVEWAGKGRPPVDYWGICCYDFPGPGGWTLDRCITAYQDHPDWNLVIGQGFDLQERNGSPTVQARRWAELARSHRKAGLLYWVWRWQGQTGAADNPELLSAIGGNS